MTDPHDFESALHDGMQDATRDVVAHPELEQRLIDTASATSWTSGGSMRSHRFPSSWVLPAAAAVITLLVAGSVVTAQQLASDKTTTSGEGSMVPGISSSAPSTISPIAPSSSSTAAPSTSTATNPHTSAAPSTSATESNPPTASSSAPPSDTSSAPVNPGFPATCTTPDTGEYKPTSLQDFESHIIGTWLVCSEPSIFGTDDAGLQINADGHWAKLTRNAAGQLVAGTSSLQKGDWVAIDDSAMNGFPAFQINLHLDGGGTVIAPAHFSTGVSRVHLDNNGVYEASYVPTSEPVH